MNGRLPLLGPDDPELRAILDQRGISAEDPPNLLRSLANYPELLNAQGEFSRLTYYSPLLTPSQRELAYLTATLANKCHY